MIKKMLNSGNVEKERIFIIAFLFCYVVAGIVAMIISILNKNYWLEYYEAVEVAFSAIVTISIFTLTSSQISITAQEKTFAGLNIRDLYEIRRKPYFCFAINVLAIMSYIALSIICLIKKEILSCIILIAAMLIYDAVFFLVETKYLFMREYAIYEVVKDLMISDKKNKQKVTEKYTNKKIEEFLKKIIIGKNMINAYERLSIKGKEDYNKRVFERLMMTQLTIIKEKEEQKLSIAKNSLDTILSIINGEMDIAFILKDDYQKNADKIRNAVSLLMGKKQIKDDLEEGLLKIFTQTFIKESKIKKEQSDIIFDLITGAIIGNIKKNDFSLIKKFKRKISSMTYILDGKIIARIILMISFVLNYYLKFNDDLPCEIIENIKKEVEESYVEENVKVKSWKELFSQINFDNVTLDEFLSDFSRNEVYLDYFILDDKAHRVIFSEELAFEWYVLNRLMSQEKNLDYAEIFKTNCDSKTFYFKQIEEMCYEEDKKSFYLKDKGQKFIDFILKRSEQIEKFKVNNCDTKFREYINSLKKQQIKKEKVYILEKNEIEQRYQKLFVDSLKEMFGYQPNLEFVDIKHFRYEFVVEKEFLQCAETQIIRKFVANTMEAIIETVKEIYFTNAEDFNNDVKELILTKNIEYVDSNLEYLAEKIFDEKDKEQYKKIFQKAKHFNEKYYWYPENSFIENDGFLFNFKAGLLVDKLNSRDLNCEILRYKRSDGQFVYNGAFYDQTELEEVIRDSIIKFELEIEFVTKTKEKGIIIYDNKG